MPGRFVWLLVIISNNWNLIWQSPLPESYWSHPELEAVWNLVLFFYLSLNHLLSNQVAFTSSRLALLQPWTANGRRVQMDCCFGSSRKAPRSISDAWTKQLSPLPGSHLVSTHTKLQFVDTDGFSNLSFQEHFFFLQRMCSILMRKVWGLKVKMHAAYVLNHSLLGSF